MIIAYAQHPDNKLALIFPTGETTIAHIIENDLPPGSSHVLLENTDIAYDFFNAYQLISNEIILNVEDAHNIQRDRWRKARKPLLDSLDIDFMKALEAGNTELQATIAAQKQALRDVTDTPITGTTADEIRATWPEILGPNPYITN